MKINTKPTISVIIASFNESQYFLMESLRSIQSQTFDDFECIVIDDSNLLESINFCRSFCEGDSRFIYIHSKERLGLSSSLNLGLNLARGKFIARFDADDVCLSERFSRQIKYLNEHPEVDVVGSNIEIIDDQGNKIAFRTYPELHDDIARGMHFKATFSNPTTMFRREVYERMGGYNPIFNFAEDLELWLRWINGGVRLANIQEFLVQYRKQDSRRNRAHWKLNLKARLINFNLNYFVPRTLGIILVSAWIAIPTWLQVAIFDRVLVSKVSKRSA